MARESNEQIPTVEILEGTDTEVTSGPPSQRDVHAWVRTAAAVATAAGVVWGASALQASGAADEKLACLTEIQMSTYLPGISDDRNFDPSDLREQLVEVAGDCDLTYLQAAFDAADRGN